MKKKPFIPSRHHILCRSRKGKTIDGNMAIIDREKHNQFHTVFENKTPEEILFMLSHYFWKNKYGENGDKYIYDYIVKHW